MSAQAAPYAALVMDARTGKILHARNADTRLHPASLTKMMTLYVAFEAIERGEISLNSSVKISKNAASEPPSKLGLKSGQKIRLRYLIRAAAVKSANDAATAIAEAISGSEAAFARRMTATAKAMGMNRTTFRNAHGLTQNGHLSTARDMATLGRRLFFDHRQYYNLFSRVTTNAGMRQVSNTNARFLNAYRGADGIKTGYTRAAGYNLVASAQRGNERIIASVFGGKNTAWRNARMAELMNLGFKRAPSNARVVRPKALGYIGNGTAIIASAQNAKRLKTAIAKAEAPLPRPGSTPLQDDVSQTVEALIARAVMDEEIEAAVLAATKNVPAMEPFLTRRPALRKNRFGNGGDAGDTTDVRASKRVAVAPSDDKHWSVHLGTYANRREAEQLLLITALREVTSLDGAYRKIEPVREDGRRLYRARFVGLSKKDAERACARLSAQNSACVPLSPGT